MSEIRKIIEAWIADEDEPRRWNPQAIDSLVEKLAPPTCRTCKHWAFRVANPSQMICMNKKLDTLPMLHDGLSADPYNLYWVQTGPDFGCIHHEPKETAKPDADAICGSKLAIKMGFLAEKLHLEKPKETAG